MLNLEQFIGTENYYRHWSCRLTYTDGVAHLAEKYGAHWIIDIVASHQLLDSVATEPFQCWNVVVENGAGFYVADDGDGNEIVCPTSISTTDFPSPGVRLWLVDGVLMLPSEY
jgi:hypothetical protein